MLTVKEPTDWNAHHPAEGLKEGEGGGEGGEGGGWDVVYFEFRRRKKNPFVYSHCYLLLSKRSFCCHKLP